jgi:hypothetical protein
MQAWNADGTGLLLSERLLNVPPQLSPPLMQAIFDEIEWAVEDEPTQVLPTYTDVSSQAQSKAPPAADAPYRAASDHRKVS